MIRIIVGRLLEIGRGEMSVDEFEHYLISKETPRVIIPAYPQGLYLSKVTYPFLDIPPRSLFTSILQNSMDNDWQEV
jgi:tRNA pseudouridine38-40 synthase